MANLISVIVATYNRADALDAVLRSLSTQSDRNFEVIVADDGSRPDTGDVVARWSARAGIPIRHVWHEDQGFRLAEIRNRAIVASQGTYCIFLDGDCLARPGFVAAHRAQAQPGWFVTGSRLLLSQAFTARILAEGLAPEQWDLGTFIGQRLRGRINRIGPLLLPWSGISAKRNERRWRGARGSNMAFWRADLDAVDGFDAAFVGWGREDSDMFARMIRHGIRRRNARLEATVLHLWHPEQDRSRLEENQRQLEQLLS
ncbi:MAG: glycosyltransferase family 2 protein, partial [Xanthobacteraceae bacterium]|nr:glycosyltransferase family 2 protein [Xanthobacteraceae bacterium]